jgi:hypothetical protein
MENYQHKINSKDFAVGSRSGLQEVLQLLKQYSLPRLCIPLKYPEWH